MTTQQGALAQSSKPAVDTCPAANEYVAQRFSVAMQEAISGAARGDARSRYFAAILLADARVTNPPDYRAACEHLKKNSQSAGVGYKSSSESVATIFGCPK